LHKKGYPFYDNGFTRSYCLRHEFLFQRIDEWMEPPLYEDFVQEDIKPPYTTLATRYYNPIENLLFLCRYDSLGRMITASFVPSWPTQRHVDTIQYNAAKREVKVHRVGYKDYSNYNIYSTYIFNENNLVTLRRRAEDCCHDTENICYHYNSYGILDTVKLRGNNIALKYEVITDKATIKLHLDSFINEARWKYTANIKLKLPDNVTLYRIHTIWGWKSIFATPDHIYVIYPHNCEYAFYHFKEDKLISISRGRYSMETEKHAMKGFTAKRKRFGWKIDSNGGDYSRSMQIYRDSVVFYDYEEQKNVQKRS
jgi:hypothetical protein